MLNGSRNIPAQAGCIERDMRREYQGAARTDTQTLKDRNSAFNECVSFSNQRIERENDAVADQALYAVTQNA